MEIHLLPALADNYIHLLHDRASGAVGVVDPGDAAPVIAWLEQRGLELTHIFNTHHHGDHVAGNADLKRRYGAHLSGPAPVPGTPAIQGLDRAVRNGDRLEFGQAMLEVLAVPGHTPDHVAYWSRASRALFCGDALFSLGCGRLFGGTFAQLWDSLLRLRSLPGDTLVYCGHEYSAANAAFALSVDPENPILLVHAATIRQARAAGRPSLPVLLQTERLANPFLQADDPGMQRRFGVDDPVACLRALRTAKDCFTPPA